MKKYSLIILFFIIVNVASYYIIYMNTQERIDSALKFNLEKLQIQYDVFLDNQKVSADTIYRTIINNSKVLEVLSQANTTQNEAELTTLRNELHNILKVQYESLKHRGVFQYQFVLPNNRSFLRMHKPEKYGDDLSSVRLDFNRVNNARKIERGFSRGKVAHGLRNVYPVFNKQNKYIGAVEISFSTDLLQKKLNDVSKLHSHFLIKKDVFNTAESDKDIFLVKYKQSYEHKDYLIAITAEHKNLVPIEDFKSRIALLQEKIESKFALNTPFSLLSKYNGEYIVMSFIPVKNNVNNEIAGYLSSYEINDNINTTIRDAKLLALLTFVVSIVLFYFCLRIIFDRNKLVETLEAYDKNVIFSQTDLSGKITHVSKAFCEISGYSKEELIGKPHNIVRHPDTPKEVFENLWSRLKKGQTLTFEVKNKKKDGNSYWVIGEFEPVYKNNKIIGYQATRQNITHLKEIDEIQKEIIFNVGSIGESRSKETANHVKRVAEYSYLLAIKYGLSKEEAEQLRQASPMHDIGKVAIPDAILNKPGKLSEKEFAVMKTHAQHGYDMLKVSNRPLLKAAATIALEHHEKYDGSGYPLGTSGESIHIYGRITALADVFDALGTDRCYKNAWDDEVIFCFIKEQSGKQFDPKLVEIFFDHLEEILEIRNKFKDN